MVVGKFAARLLHHPDVGVVQAPTRTHAIEQNAHLHAGAGALDQRVAESPADFVGVNNVGLEIDRLFRAADGRQHGGEIRVAILQQLDLVPGHRHRVGEGERGAEKFRVLHAEGVLDVIFDDVSANEKNAEDRHDPEKSEEDSDPFEDFQFPPTELCFLWGARHGGRLGNDRCK